tara:strand:- start:55 stop:300 length:246 start_codon:yes stop_codon:yes gene_type:complete
MTQEEVQFLINKNKDLKATIFDITEANQTLREDYTNLVSHLKTRLYLRGDTLQEVLENFSSKFPIPEVEDEEDSEGETSEE